MGLAMDAQWTALVMAGQRPGIDPVADAHGVASKAMVPLAGKPMLAHVLAALDAAPPVARIVVLAQDLAALEPAAIGVAKPVRFVQSGAGIAAAVRAVAGTDGVPWPVFVTTADHPLLTPDMIAAFLAAAGGDLSVGMVERSDMLRQFPDARRTWLKFADGHWSGTNLFALTGPAVDPALALWSRAEQDRKRVLKLFIHFGPWLAFRAATRTIGLATALQQAGHRLGLDARLVRMADPVAAIDVDKLTDHALAEAITANRKAPLPLT